MLDTGRYFSYIPLCSPIASKANNSLEPIRKATFASRFAATEHSPYL